MSDSSPVRVAVVGTGGIAVRHLTNLLRSTEVTLAGLMDIEPARCQAALTRAAARQDPPRQPPDVPVFAQLERLLREIAPDAAIIAVPPYAHGDIELACIEAGVHLLVQKPLGLEMRTVRTIQRAIESRGLVSSVGHQARYSAAVAEGRAALTGHPVGMAIGTYLGGLPGTPWWRVQARSGGQVVEQATHVVDLMRYVVGEVESVYANAATRLLADVPDLDIADVSVATLRFQGGAVGTLLNTCALSSVPNEAWEHGLTLIARELSVRMWLDGVRIARPDGVHLLPAGDDPYAALDAAFVAAVASGDPAGIRSSYADAATTLQLTLAIEESISRKQPVTPAELG